MLEEYSCNSLTGNYCLEAAKRGLIAPKSKHHEPEMAQGVHDKVIERQKDARQKATKGDV